MPAFESCAVTYYGTLRGGEVIDIKSPYSGIIKHQLPEDGQVYKNESPICIESYELNSKKSILKIKIENLKSKIHRLQMEYDNIVEDYKKGFVSLSSVNEKEYVLKEEKINLEELKIELKALENTLALGNPVISGKFIIRQFYTVDKQVVNAGDNIVRVETLDKFLIDIKFDPVAVKGRIQDKDIKFKSLVTGASGKAIVMRVSNPKDNDNTQGAQIASLLLTTEVGNIYQLLDTVFEITIHDKDKH